MKKNKFVYVVGDTVYYNTDTATKHSVVHVGQHLTLSINGTNKLVPYGSVLPTRETLERMLREPVKIKPRNNRVIEVGCIVTLPPQIDTTESGFFITGINVVNNLISFTFANGNKVGDYNRDALNNIESTKQLRVVLTPQEVRQNAHPKYGYKEQLYAQLKEYGLL